MHNMEKKKYRKLGATRDWRMYGGVHRALSLDQERQRSDKKKKKKKEISEKQQYSNIPNTNYDFF